MTKQEMTHKDKSEEKLIPKECSHLNLPSKEIKEECTKELKEVCKRLGIRFGDSAFKVVLAVYWEGKKQGLKEGDMYALDYTLIHFGNEDALKAEIKKLKTELKNETRSHTYWREEYYKLIDKEITK